MDSIQVPNKWNVYLKDRDNGSDHLATRETAYVFYLALKYDI